MAYGSTYDTDVHQGDSGFHIIVWTFSILAVFAAALGAWIMLAPDDGTISIFGRTWAASDLTNTWGPWLLIVGGGVAAVGMAISAARDRHNEEHRWLVAAEVLVALVGAAVLVVGVALLV